MPQSGKYLLDPNIVIAMFADEASFQEDQSAHPTTSGSTYNKIFQEIGRNRPYPHQKGDPRWKNQPPSKKLYSD